jgi:putative PEP-CTERM system TPR-repeat lipoprotein
MEEKIMLQSTKGSPLRRTGISLLLAALLAGCSGEKPEQFLDKARQQYGSGNKAAAVIELKNAIQKNPEYAEARLLLGKIYNEQGDGASAEKELRKALQLGTEKASVLPQLGRALLIQREYNKVLEELPASPGGKAADSAAIFVARGDALTALKRLDEAKAAYEEARRLDPTLAEANQGLAILAIIGQQPEEAMRLADEAIQKSKSGDPWLLKADLQRAQGKNAEAAQSYQEALKRDAANVGAHLSLASLHLQEQKFDEAQKELDAARKAEPNSLPVRLAQAQLDFAQKKFPQARDNLQEILKAAPNHGPAILLMGATQLSLESYVQAETYLSTYVKSAPNNVYARRLLAATYLKNKQPAKALDALGPLLAKDPQDGTVLALAGDAYLQLKDYAKATEHLDRAAKAIPDNAALRTELALSRLAGGDTARGTTELETAAEMAGSPLQTDVALIYALLSKQQYDKALNAVGSLEKKQPDNPLVHNLRGGVYVGKQDFANARQAFEKALSLQPGYYPAAANLAQLDMRDKKPQAARSRFDGILAADKNNASAMVAIAELERAAGREKEYVAWLDKATRADAKAIKPRTLLAQYYVGKNEAPRALSIAREAQTANPNDPEALNLLGNAQLAANEKDNAVATFGKLVALAPQSPLAYVRLGAAQAVNNSPTEARKSLRLARELKPDLIDAQTAMIGLDLQENRTDDAIKRAQQIQQQHPKLATGYEIEAGILASQKQYAKSAELYQKALDVGRNSVLAQKLHVTLAAAGKTGEAETRAAQWLKEHPEDVGMRVYLGETYIKQGQDKQAIAQYQAILQKSPDNLIALNNLAWLLQKQRDPQAVVHAERAHKLRPEDPSVMDTLGWILVEQGKTARGLELLQRALAKAPDVADIRYHLAVALFKSGDKVRAEAELKRVLDSGTKFSQEREAETLLAQIRAGR